MTKAIPIMSKIKQPIPRHIPEGAVKVNQQKCYKCIYSCGGLGKMTCDYYLKTGMRRGCPVGWCDKYKRGNPDKYDWGHTGHLDDE